MRERLTRLAVVAGAATLTTVVGPDDRPGFTLTGPAWVEHPGSGEFGGLRWAPDAADLLGVWNPVLSPGRCHAIATFVPEVYSDTTAARYTVASARGTVISSVDENDFTNRWATLGVFTGIAGRLPVILTNDDPFGDYVAADALRFVLDSTCT